MGGPGIEPFRSIRGFSDPLVSSGTANSGLTRGIATDPITSREMPAQHARTSFRHRQAGLAGRPYGGDDVVAEYPSSPQVADVRPHGGRLP
jgi:hypothetical protein